MNSSAHYYPRHQIIMRGCIAAGTGERQQARFDFGEWYLHRAAPTVSVTERGEGMRRGWEMMGDPLRREDTPPDTSEQHRLRLPLRPPRETLSPLRPFNPLLAWDPKGGTRFRLQHVAKGIGEQSSNAPCPGSRASASCRPCPRASLGSPSRLPSHASRPCRSWPARAEPALVVSRWN
jgi:hypothetical protein